MTLPLNLRACRQVPVRDCTPWRYLLAPGLAPACPQIPVRALRRVSSATHEVCAWLGRVAAGRAGNTARSATCMTLSARPMPLGR